MAAQLFSWSFDSTTEVFRKVEAKSEVHEVQSTMTTNYIDAVVYLCYIDVIN